MLCALLLYTILLRLEASPLSALFAVLGKMTARVPCPVSRLRGRVPLSSAGTRRARQRASPCAGSDHRVFLPTDLAVYYDVPLRGRLLDPAVALGCDAACRRRVPAYALATPAILAISSSAWLSFRRVEVLDNPATLWGDWVSRVVYLPAERHASTSAVLARVRLEPRAP